MSILDNDQLTPREHMLMENEAEQGRLIREHAVRMKELDVQLQREKNLASVELKHLEAKWSSWLKLPSILLKLPVYIFLGLGFVVFAIRGQEPPKDFWTHLK